MDSVEREEGSVYSETNTCSNEMTKFVKVLSKMISRYYTEEEEEQD